MESVRAWTELCRVGDAYGFSEKKDLLEQVLDLNTAVVAALKRGDFVTAPGVPPSYGTSADLITDDCIQA